ncbi:TPA: class I SAM-dependent methyltransferase, partial [Escherichia coli]|nr:class I SAM-dependent methyltransferase [Escherichia coli]
SDSSKVYTPFTLKLYDWWVLDISNRFAWRCETRKYLLPHYLKHVKYRHLDIGVGTGFYLPYLPEEYNISLMDLNTASLDAASRRIGNRQNIKVIKHDVLECFPENLHNQYDSVSMFYLLHCLPGTMEQKNIVIKNAAASLTDGGVLFGATILGKDVEHNAFGHKLISIYNRKGIFSNRDDSEEVLKNILSSHFKSINVKKEGVVAIFSATNKK